MSKELQEFVLLLQYAEVRASLCVGFSVVIPLLLRFVFGVNWMVLSLVVAGMLYVATKFAAGPKFEESADLSEKVILITGAATGIGYENAIEFAKMGATVVIAGRGLARLQRVVSDVKQFSRLPASSTLVSSIELDLSSLASIRRAAAEFKRQYSRLDILVCNAGVMMCPHMLTQDGLELQMGTNHFGHFLLTSLLQDYIIKSRGRVVVLASIGHHSSYRVAGGTNYYHYARRENYDKVMAYSQSKLMNILFAVALNERLSQHGASAYAAHPGSITQTELGRHFPTPLVAFIRFLTPLLFKTIKGGAATTTFCAISPHAQPGGYHSDCRIITATASAMNRKYAQELWALSERLCHVENGSEVGEGASSSHPPASNPNA